MTKASGNKQKIEIGQKQPIKQGQKEVRTASDIKKMEEMKKKDVKSGKTGDKDKDCMIY